MAYGAPYMSQLPKHRVEGDKAFSAYGIDFMGPLFLKPPEGDGESKSYVALITCCSSRMTHLELCSSMDTAALLGCLKRYFARRGIPALIISDNAKYFKSTSLKSFIASRGVTWRYNLAKAPWWGGLFERMIRSTKRCLKKSLKNQKFSYENLTTVLAEIEAVLNSRPLTYIHADSTNVLTPFHLYCGTRTLDPPDPRIIDFTEMTANAARAKVLKLDKLINSFWSTWSKDYLTSLRENAINKGRKGEGPKVGDVVVIHEDNVKRALWKLGRVVDLIKGKDGVIRGARVKTNSRYSGGVIDRPLQKLFPLEMGRGEKENENSGNVLADAPVHELPSAVSEETSVPDPPKPSKAKQATCSRYPLRSKSS